MENKNNISTELSQEQAPKTGSIGWLIFFMIISIVLCFVTGPGVILFAPLAVILLIVAIVRHRKLKQNKQQGVQYAVPKKCKRCGRGGVFHKILVSGFCKSCEKDGLTETVEKLKSEILVEESKLQNIKAEQENIYSAAKDQAQKDVFSELKFVNEEIENKRKEIIVFDETIMLESFALYIPKFKFTTSAEYKVKLDAIRDEQKTLIRNDKAAYGNNNWTVGGNAAEGKKLSADMKKLLLRSFNNECDYCVDNVKFNNIEASEKRIEKSFDTLNKLGRIMQTGISDDYKKLKYDELYLAYEYQKKKEEEKEAAKKAREELREQQKLERELKEARERIAKEQKHLENAIKEYNAKLAQTDDEAERALILQNIEDANNKFAELNKEEKLIDYREQNAKSGYVYVISNIGSFGNDVYKIGMTRRLEPMERVDELGDASVPFEFDVHALVFSDNAPELEAKLHEHFYDSRVNKLNDRKEFFKADINEIERVLKENYKKVVDVVKDAPAEQYRESLLLESKTNTAP